MSKKIDKLIENKGTSIAFFLVIIGFVIIIISLFLKPFNDCLLNSDATLFGLYGNFIGGLCGAIFSIASIILIYKTFVSQREALELQKETFLSERNDNLFFNLLEFQQNIINNIKAYFFQLNNNLIENINIKESRDFFIFSKDELIKIWHSLKSSNYAEYFEDARESALNDIYNLYQDNNGEDIEDKSRDEKKIREEFNLRYTNKIYNISKSKWDEINKKPIPEKMKDMYIFYFIKFQYAIDHYFRHFYQILAFIEQTDINLTNSAKSKNEIEMITKNYVDFLLSQMSSFELMLLFYNSLSFSKALNTIKKYNILKNLSVEDLVDQEHNCIEGIHLKNQSSLLEIEN